MVTDQRSVSAFSVCPPPPPRCQFSRVSALWSAVSPPLQLQPGKSMTEASQVGHDHKYWGQRQTALGQDFNMPLTEITIFLNGVYPKNSPAKVTLTINLFCVWEAAQMMPKLFLKNNLSVTGNCKINCVTHEKTLLIIHAEVILQGSPLGEAGLSPQLRYLW